MSAVIEEEIKRWTARRKSALVLGINQGKSAVAEASRQFDLTVAEIEDWVERRKSVMENALRAEPKDVSEQYVRQIKDFQKEWRSWSFALKEVQSQVGEDEKQSGRTARESAPMDSERQ